MHTQEEYGCPEHEMSRSELITVALLLALALGRLDADLLVVLLERCEILASLRELTFLHALAHIPVHEGTLGYMRSNLWSMREKTSATAVELEIMHTARMTLARS